MKAPPGLGIETVPKRAETYDSFCGPLMEKIIGTSEYPSTGFDWMEFVSVIVILLRGRFKYKGQ